VTNIASLPATKSSPGTALIPITQAYADPISRIRPFIQERLKVLTCYFINLSRYRQLIWLSASELDNVPRPLVAQLAKGQPGTANENQYGVTNKNVAIGTLLKHMSNATARKRLYIWKEELFKPFGSYARDLFLLRAVKASLQGHESHHDFRSNKMGNMETFSVKSFLSDVSSIAQQSLKRRTDEICQLKAMEQPRDILDHGLQPWDLAFYTQRRTELLNGFAKSDFEEYFPLDTTVRGCLKLFGELFGLRFHEISMGHRDYETLMNGYKSWATETAAGLGDTSIPMFAVFNDQEMGGGFLGYLFLDLIHRQEKFHKGGLLTRIGMVNTTVNDDFFWSSSLIVSPLVL
jgi:metallopeptidase MepB